MLVTSQVCGKEPDAGKITADLLRWIKGARRDLPWRRRRDPYAVWISEIMLQQTQVVTVVPYFLNWLSRFPDVAALASAPLDEVLKAWEGLGYYARARHLHETAKLIMSEHHGEIPSERSALLRLPGIGRYTAGAILSLAFGQPEPILDGNVRRVLCRVYDIAEDPRLPAVEAHLWSLASTLVTAAPRGQAGELNEALMELGALICTPGVPACSDCPLAGLCLANERGNQSERPVRTVKPALPHYHGVAAVIQDEWGRYLIAQRPSTGLLGSLWEFPGQRLGIPDTEHPHVSELTDFVADTLHETLAIAVTPAPGGPFLRVRHAYTHFRLTLHVFRCRIMSGSLQPIGYDAVQWVAFSDLGRFAFPVTDQKIIAALQPPSGWLLPE